MAVTNWMLVVVAFFAFVAVSAVGHDLLPSGFLEQKPDSLASDLLELGPILQQDIIDRVNGDKKATWKAGRSRRFESHTVKDFKKLCGTIMSDVNAEDDDMVVVSRKGTSTVELPKNFDSREAWPKCTTIGNILDQGHCGSCWAFGAVESLSDRFCIHGFENVNLSENDLLSCCGFECGYGCDGGYPYRAWQYFKRTGVVSESCDPYFDTIGCGHPGCSPTYDTPVCRKTCIGDDLWAESKHYASSAYYVSSDPEELMLELYMNGPFEVSFNVFEDFAHYESGVYKHTTGGYMGGHAVKLIGWGVTEDGVDYWTIANSWNAEWGEEGYFRIVRGLNDCGIETGATAGIPYIRGEASAM